MWHAVSSIPARVVAAQRLAEDNLCCPPPVAELQLLLASSSNMLRQAQGNQHEVNLLAQTDSMTAQA